MAADKKCTAAQLVLAWILAQGEHIVPIPGSKQRARVEENWKALDVRLTPDDMARIEQISPKGVAVGERYGAAWLCFVILIRYLDFERRVQVERINERFSR